MYRDGERLALTRKSCLPNYRVFDEKRYFSAGGDPAVFECQGIKLGLLVCEDVWEPEPARRARALGAEVLLVINASPFEMNRQRERERVVRERVARVRRAGGLRESVRRPGRAGVRRQLLRDGRQGRAGVSRAGLHRRPVPGAVRAARAARVVPLPGEIAPELEVEASVYQALVLGVRDYVNKHGFPGVVMGLSGGVDSALTLAIAVDALGAERVQAVMMPSRYTSQMSKDDALAQARSLGVQISSIPIEGLFEAALGALAAEFAGRAPDTTEENIQARVRGLLLMAISNKTGRMLLTTGNKSEMAVGYATLYGDMNGGFAPIKDCSKLLVYRLANYRNAQAGAGAPGHTAARDRARAERRTAPGPEGHRFAAALRGARSDPRGVHRRGPVGR